MKRIDRKLLNKFYDVVTSKSFAVPVSSDQVFPDRDIFLSKFGKFLWGKYFKLQFDITPKPNYNSLEPPEPKYEVVYACMVPVKTTRYGKSIQGYGLSHAYSMDLFAVLLSYMDHTGKSVRRKLTYADLIKLRYEEITGAEFLDIYEKFQPYEE